MKQTKMLKDIETVQYEAENTGMEKELMIYCQGYAMCQRLNGDMMSTSSKILAYEHEAHIAFALTYFPFLHAKLTKPKE